MEEEPFSHHLELGKPMARGMTLRDYFAGQALAGMTINDDGDYCQRDHAEGRLDKQAHWCASAAYRIADAMLIEREKANG